MIINNDWDVEDIIILLNFAVLTNQILNIMDYTMQNELSRKANQYEVDNLNSQIRTLENEVREFKNAVSKLRSQVSNHQYALMKLIDMLIESENYPDYEDQLSDLGRYI